MTDSLTNGNSSLVSTVKTVQTTVETGGVTFNTGATVAPVGNATTWSRASATADLAAGSITQAQYNSDAGVGDLQTNADRCSQR